MSATVPTYAQPDWCQTNHGLGERASAYTTTRQAGPVGSVATADDGPLDVTVRVAQDHEAA